MSNGQEEKNSHPYIFTYKKKIYPNYIKCGNACSYVTPYAEKLCKGKGLDIGGYFEWTFPGAKPINITINDRWDAYNLPRKSMTISLVLTPWNICRIMLKPFAIGKAT